MSDPYVAHTNQRMPGEWAHMVAGVQAVVDLTPELPYERQVAAGAEAVRLAAGLSPSALKGNYSYAAGLATCKLAECVFSPDTAGVFVAKLADALVAKHEERPAHERGGGLCLGDMEILDFMKKQDLGERPLPMAERILANMLTARKREGYSSGQPQPGDVEYLLLADRTAIRVREASVIGPLLVAQTALKNLYQAKWRTPVQPETWLADFVDRATIDNMDLTRAASAATSMRFDGVLRLFIDNLIRVDATGRVSVSETALALALRLSQDMDRAEAANDSVPENEANITDCPARHVAGLTPHIVKLVQRAVNTAQSRLVPYW